MEQQTFNQIVAALARLCTEIQCGNIDPNKISVKELKDKLHKWLGYPHLFVK